MSEIKLDVNGFLDFTSLKSGDKNNKTSSKIASGTSFKDLLGNNVQLMNSKNKNTEEMLTGFEEDNEEDDLLSTLSAGKSSLELSSKDFSNELLNKGHRDEGIGGKPSISIDNKDSKSVNLIDKLSNMDSTQKPIIKGIDEATGEPQKLINLEKEVDNLIKKISDKLELDIESKTSNKVSKDETDIAPKNIDKSSNTSLDESVNLNNSSNNIMQLFNVNNKIEDTSKAISTKDNESINDNIKELVNLKSEIHREIQLLTNDVKPIIDRIQLPSKSVDLVQKVVSTNTDKITEVLKKLVDLETKIDGLIGNISNKSDSELDLKDFLNALLSRGHSDGVIADNPSTSIDNKDSKSVNLIDKLSNMDSTQKPVIKGIDETAGEPQKLINLEKEVDNLIKKISDKLGLDIESKASNKVSKAETDIASENIDKSSNTSLDESVNLNNSSNNIMQLFNVNNKIEDTTKAISTKDNESINDSIKKLVNLKNEIHREIQLLTNEVKPLIDRMQLPSNMSLVVPKEFSDNNIELMNSKSEIVEKILKEFGKVTEDDNSLLKLINKDNSIQDLQKKLLEGNSVSSEYIEKLDLLSKLSEGKSSLESSNKGDVDSIDNLNKDINKGMLNTISISDKSSSVDLVQNVVSTNTDKITEVLKKLVDLETKIDNLIKKISDKLGLDIESKASNKVSKAETDIASESIDKSSNTSLDGSVNVNNSPNNIMKLFNVNNKIEDATKAISTKDNESINDSVKELVNLKSEIHREIQLLTNEVKPIIDRIKLSSNMSLEAVPKEISDNNIELMNSKSEITEKMLKEIGKVTEDDNSLLKLISKDINKGTSNIISISDKSSNVDLVQNLVDINVDEIVGKLKKLVNLENKIDELIENISSLTTASYKDNNTINSNIQFVNTKNNNLLMQSVQQEHQRNINKKVSSGENLIENKIFNNSLEANQLKGQIVNDEMDLLSSKNEHSSEFKKNNSFNSENKFLKGLLEDNKDIKFDKVNTLMGQFVVQNQNDSQDIVSAPKVIDKSNFTSDIIKSITYMETKDIKNMIVKINPKELGEIYIKITATADGIMKANISANSRETFNLLNAHIQDLNNSLNNSQIKIQHIDINIYNGDTTFFSNNFNQSQGDKNNSQSQNYNNVSYINSEEEPAAPEETIYEDNKLNTLA